MADEVDVVRLVVVHRMEVIVAVDRVQGAVVGELLLGDGRVVNLRLWLFNQTLPETIQVLRLSLTILS